MMEKPPTRDVKGVNLTKGKIMLDPYVRESLDDAWDERPVPPAGKGLSRPESDAAYPTPPEGSSL